MYGGCIVGIYSSGPKLIQKAWNWTNGDNYLPTDPHCQKENFFSESGWSFKEENWEWHWRCLFEDEETWAEIHHALISQFSLLVEFFLGKVTVKGWNSRVLRLVNLDHGQYQLETKENLLLQTVTPIVVRYLSTWVTFFPILVSSTIWKNKFHDLSDIISVAIFGDLSRIWLLLTPFGHQNFLFGYLSFLATFLATFENLAKNWF